MAKHEEVADKIETLVARNEQLRARGDFISSELEEKQIKAILASHYPSVATNCPECQGEKVGYICVCDDCHAQWDQSTCPSAAVKKLVEAMRRISKYQDVDELRKSADEEYGIGADEAIQMAYENVLFEAHSALKPFKEVKP